MTWHEELGWVEQGTAGHRASAQVPDLGREQRLLLSWAEQARREEALLRIIPAYAKGPHRTALFQERQEAAKWQERAGLDCVLNALEHGHREEALFWAWVRVFQRLAALTPFAKVVRDEAARSEERRQREEGLSR